MLRRVCEQRDRADRARAPPGAAEAKSGEEEASRVKGNLYIQQSTLKITFNVYILFSNL